MKCAWPSAAERDRAMTRAEALAGSVAAAGSRYALLQAGTRPEKLTQLRAQLAELDTQVRELRILAPTNCVLELLSVRVGDVLAPNREAATLLLPDHLWVRVFVPEPWLGGRKPGDVVTVRTGQRWRGGPAKLRARGHGKGHHPRPLRQPGGAKQR